jgi:DNA-binding NarL/FixJ family response regulator
VTAVGAGVRVVLVDDQVLLRKAFRVIFDETEDIAVVGEAGDGAAGVRVVEQTRPDVVLMDIRMPGIDGVEATRRIRSLPVGPHETDAPRVLILTTFDLDEYVYAALRAGASGFLLKDAPADQLVSALRIVASGEAMLAPSVTRRLITQLTARRPRPGEQALIATLTAREREVLTLMSDGLSNAEIAAQLVLGESTIKTHAGRVLNKLGARDRVQAVVMAFRAGEPFD